MSARSWAEPQPAPDRMPMPAALTPAQREAAAAIRSGPRGELVGPFVPLLRCPELMTRVQLVGEHLRFGGTLGAHLTELVVLQVARHWDQQFEWGYHQPKALEAGLGAAVVEDLAAGRAPQDAPPDVAAVWALVDELLTARSVGDETYAGVAAVLGEEQVVEAVAVAGYYTLLAMVMNTARTPAPPGAPRLPAPAAR